MKKNPFGNTGLQVSPLGFGGAPIGLLETEREKSKAILTLLLNGGVNVIDTAAMYGNSEEIIAETIGARRDEFVLITKCGSEVEEIDAPAWSRELIARTVDRSLKRLQTEQLDVILLHSCDKEVLKRGEALSALVTAREQGKVRFVGYSGDNDALTYAASLPEVDVVETSINLCDQANIDQGVAVARKNGLGIIAKRPIANAAWRNDLPGFYQGYAADYAARFSRMGLTGDQLGFEGDPAKVWPEIALRFAMAFADTSIIGTTNPDNASANLAAAEKGPLSDELVAKIRAAFRAGRGDEDWPGLT